MGNIWCLQLAKFWLAYITLAFAIVLEVYAYSPSIAAPADVEHFRMELFDTLARKFNSDVTSYPREVAAALKKASFRCSENKDSIAPIGTFVSVSDLNNDQTPDIIIDFRGACAINKRLFCDEEDRCQYQIWLSTSTDYVLALDSKIFLARLEGPNNITLEYPPSSCNLPKNSPLLCQSRYTVQGSRIIPQR